MKKHGNTGNKNAKKPDSKKITGSGSMQLSVTVDNSVYNQIKTNPKKKKITTWLKEAIREKLNNK